MTKLETNSENNTPTYRALHHLIGSSDHITDTGNKLRDQYAKVFAKGLKRGVVNKIIYTETRYPRLHTTNFNKIIDDDLQRE
jgi:hypothetical protein